MYPVEHSEQLLGCVTLARVREIPREKRDRIRVRDITEPCSEVNTISPSADAMEALTLMQKHRVSRLLVVKDGELAGILTLRDLMAFLSMKVELESV
jgi:CBS domain-containing protein